ncbi:phosphate acyltransferase PlsX [Lishizhenia sp.]|uniref:phosphate acyltransferase PlsX n=1 Tax=Lishizhenia sp. TaxID=2497594 RepID=UPI00299E3C89|nr:phosphate acyltransferase PlsX [Lishizhenia sp.]MDX1444825.1 phosphate acyltransferase PlsX [Lishizhenia sp.]
MKIGLDIMGGDFAPEANVSGAILANKELPQDTRIVLFGDQDVVREKLVELGGNPDDFEIVHAPDVITMHDHPTRAIPQKPNSTISKGFDLLASGEIQAFASTGNTGAMLVGAIYKVNAVPGIIRPCITSTIPNIRGGNSLILDVGANADCKPDVLYQFAILGSLYAREVYGIENPKVGLLNIGEEETKGNLLTQSAYKLMQGSTDFNFAGNIEGRDIFTGKVDVIVCDGFTGNVVLKQAEGLFGLMQKRGMRDEYFDRFNYENYGGTPILGVNSNVIIGHGISNDIAVKNMLLHSYDVTKSKLTDKIKEAIN